MDEKNIFDEYKKLSINIVTNILSQELNVEKHLHLLIEGIRNYFNTDICFIGLLIQKDHSKDSKFDIVSVSAEDQDEARRIEEEIKEEKDLFLGIRRGKIEGVTVWCIQNNEHFINGTLHKKETQLDLEKKEIIFKDPKYKLEPIKSELCVPFYYSDKNTSIKGALDIEDTRINKYEKKHVPILSLFGHLALMIIANAKSLINFMKIIKCINLSSFITEPILNSFLKIAGAQCGFICSRDPFKKDIIDVKAITTDDLKKSIINKYGNNNFMERDFGLNLKAFKSDPQYESDVKKIKYFKSFWNKTVKSNAAIPLKHESQVIGSLDLEYSERKVFSKMDQDILEALAGLPEVALIKANLSKDLEELYARSPLESKTRREKRINEVLMHCQDIAKSKECLLVFYDNDKKPFSKFGDKNIKYKFIKKNIAPTDTQQHIIVHANGKDYLLIKILENIIEFFINLTDINKSQSVYLFINKIMPDLLNIREFELHEENIENTKKCFSRYGIIVGDNPQMQYVLRQVTAAVKSKNTTVFIEGESGTGKELIANVIHRLSKGRKTYRTYAAINCAALPEQLLESELFGTKEGAFTGAVSRSGYFETIRNGTILLDEITEMTIASQAKLLRALQTGEFYRLGSTKKMKIKDTRIIASTNKNLEEEVAKEKFRSDLFYRLNAIKIRVPSLRERREHILELSEKFLKKYGEDLDKPKEGFSDEATRYLYSYSWPGNIRELDNSIARAVINEVGPIIHVNYLLSDVVSATSVDFEPSRKSIKLKYPHMVGLEERDIFKLEDDEIEKINSYCWFLDQDTQPTKENIEKYLKISKSAFYILRRKYNLPYPKKRNDLTF